METHLSNFQNILWTHLSLQTSKVVLKGYLNRKDLIGKWGPQDIKNYHQNDVRNTQASVWALSLSCFLHWIRPSFVKGLCLLLDTTNKAYAMGILNPSPKFQESPSPFSSRQTEWGFIFPLLLCLKNWGEGQERFPCEIKRYPWIKSDRLLKIQHRNVFLSVKDLVCYRKDCMQHVVWSWEDFDLC